RHPLLPGAERADRPSRVPRGRSDAGQEAAQTARQPAACALRPAPGYRQSLEAPVTRYTFDDLTGGSGDQPDGEHLAASTTTRSSPGGRPPPVDRLRSTLAAPGGARLIGALVALVGVVLLVVGVVALGGGDSGSSGAAPAPSPSVVTSPASPSR